jgi:hypothetical protein
MRSSDASSTRCWSRSLLSCKLASKQVAKNGHPRRGEVRYNLELWTDRSRWSGGGARIVSSRLDTYRPSPCPPAGLEEFPPKSRRRVRDTPEQPAQTLDRSGLTRFPESMVRHASTHSNWHGVGSSPPQTKAACATRFRSTELRSRHRVGASAPPARHVPRGPASHAVGRRGGRCSRFPGAARRRFAR